MMSAFFRFTAVLLASASVLLTSCGGNGSADYDNTAAIVPRSTELGSDGGSVFVAVTAAAGWTISLEFPDSEPWATMDPASGSGSQANVRMRYDANTSDASRKVVLTLKPTNGLAASVTVIQAGLSNPSPDPGTGDYGEDVASPKWLELPATKAGDGRNFFVHDMEGRGYVNAAVSGVRNWSFYWDYREHLALWVAYPMNNSLKGNGSRTNEWGYDPLLPVSIQPSLIGGSYGGGWTRGHQIPSADRLSYKANVSTFYGTNMTPQDYNFNSFIWADLENRVRAYAASSDTLYVVTGCLFDKSVTYSGTSSGFAVKIPTHYFKAMLYRGPSSYAAGGYMAAGFLLPHDSSIARGNCLSYIMSIDKLEAETGIDFFPNLATEIGKAAADAIEAAEPSTWWK